MKTLVRILIASITLLVVAASCDRSQFYAQSRNVDEHGWSSTERLPYDIEIDDTNQIYNFLVDVRINTSYPYSNTFFFITTTFPDGSIAADTMECPLAAPDGQWLGRRTGRYVDNRYYFRKNIRFPQTGRYHFDISHGMRDDSIAGLKDVGIRLEYAK